MDSARWAFLQGRGLCADFSLAMASLVGESGLESRLRSCKGTGAKLWHVRSQPSDSQPSDQLGKSLLAA